MNKKSRKIWIIIGIVFLVLILSGIIFFVIKNHTNDSQNGGKDSKGSIQMELSENMVSATGTTTIGIDEEKFDLDYIETELDIEEVYLSSGDVVEKGTKILKVNEEDVQDIREELENALEEAQLAYRAGKITYEQSKIEAQYDYDSSILAGEYAQEVYDETIADLQKQIEEAQKSLEEAQEDLSEYKDAVEKDSYDEKYQVSYLQQKYDDDYELLKKKVSKWGLIWSDVTGQDDDGEKVQTSEEGKRNANLSTAQELYKEVCEEYEELKSAREQYEEALNEATYGLQKMEKEVPVLELKVQEAENALEEGTISAKAAYDTSRKKASMAQDTYDTSIKKAEEELELLQDDLDDATDHLNEFEETIGDGYMYTSNAGTILFVMAREEQALTGESTVLAYSNSEEITVSVSVSQTDIDKLRVGESAYVMISEYGEYQGYISSINPISSSNSRASVTYQVTVQLEGDVSQLTANLTAQVIFGAGGNKDAAEN